MNESPSILTQFRQMSPTIQWSVLIASAIVLFIVWDEYLKPVADGWNDRAEEVHRMVDDVRKVRNDLESLPESEQHVVINFGRVLTPRQEADVAIAFHDVVNEVLQNHSVIDASFSAQARGKLPKNALPTITRGKKIERLNGDLKFTAKPSTVVAIIAELESSPHIEAVNTVRMSKDTSENVKAHLVIEAWGFAPEKKRGEFL